MSFMFNLEDYEPVEKRLGYKKDAKSFWEDYPDGRIFTKLLDFANGRYIVQAFVYRTEVDQHPWTTGLAEETVSGRGVNSTSALENAETSSIGRALATAGYATKGKRPSREEMSKVAAKNVAQSAIADVKVKMAETAKEYVPISKEDDPWTIRDAEPAKTVDEAVAIVKDIIGGQTERDIPRCSKCHDHKEMTWKTGTGKNGRPYANFSCWTCKDIIWYEISKEDGTWIPQKAKY
jgi:hypothetical protein